MRMAMAGQACGSNLSVRLLMFGVAAQLIFPPVASGHGGFLSNILSMRSAGLIHAPKRPSRETTTDVSSSSTDDTGVTDEDTIQDSGGIYTMTELCSANVTSSDIRFSPNSSYHGGILQLAESDGYYPSNFRCTVCIHPGVNKTITFWFAFVDIHVTDQYKCIPERITFYAMGSPVKYHLCQHLLDMELDHTWGVKKGLPLCVEFQGSSDDQEDGHGNHRGFVLHFHAVDSMRWWEALAWSMGSIGVLLFATFLACTVPFKKVGACVGKQCSTTVLAVLTCGLSVLISWCCRKVHSRRAVQPTRVIRSSDAGPEDHQITYSYTPDQDGLPPSASGTMAGMMCTPPPLYNPEDAYPPEYKESRASSCNPPAYDEGGAGVGDGGSGGQPQYGEYGDGQSGETHN